MFITGHTGFKGTWLSLLLQNLGATTAGYALAPTTDNCIFNLTHPYQSYISHIDDIRDQDKLEKAILEFQPDFIFHLAAQPLVRESYRIPVETFEINTMGTTHILQTLQALQKKCTIIIVTTDKVYENLEQHVHYAENSRLGGHDPYSASKACTELVVQSYRSSFFPETTYAGHLKAIASARAGNVIGGGDYSADRIIPDLIRALTANEALELRNPDAIRPWQHVLEPLTGYLLLAAMLHEDISYSGAYNFGPVPEDHLTVRELAEVAIKYWGSGQWQNIRAENTLHEAALLKLDIQKSWHKLNWRPRWSARKAIQMTINWYKEVGVADMKELSLQQIETYFSAHDI